MFCYYFKVCLSWFFPEQPVYHKIRNLSKKEDEEEDFEIV